MTVLSSLLPCSHHVRGIELCGLCIDSNIQKIASKSTAGYQMLIPVEYLTEAFTTGSSKTLQENVLGQFVKGKSLIIYAFLVIQVIGLL